MKYHMMAYVGGFLLDLLVGDPYCLPHPIRWIGSLVSRMERLFRKNETDSEVRLRIKGGVLWGIVTGLTVLATALLLLGAYALCPQFGCLVETIMTYQIFAAKCLATESRKVYRCLCDGDLSGARYAVSMIVGRDTKNLDDKEITRAAVETVAENTSDGVIAPMLYTAFGGPVLGFFYKAVNTMDSMLGYKNETYLHFGRVAAKCDDFFNFLPARISGLLLILASAMGGREYGAAEAWRIYRRDRKKHASPNAAQTEAVCAGALGIRLAGDTSYFGKVVKKPYIGDPAREIEYKDILRVNRLMYLSAWSCLVLCVGVMLLLN